MNGTAWYLAGKGLSKLNSFYDVIDVAECLTRDWQVAGRTRLAMQGRSAGGLLMGAVLTMRPDLPAVVVLHVPFLVCTHARAHTRTHTCMHAQKSARGWPCRAADERVLTMRPNLPVLVVLHVSLLV